LKKTLYLIPTPLAEDTVRSLPTHTIEVIHRLEVFIVEKAKTCRRFVSATKHPKPIHDLIFVELDKHDPVANVPIIESLFAEHNEVGFMSEAGCPGVADPGSEYVWQAHEKDIQVIPLVGPSSILLALMASGLNGQNFQFHGYLSPKKDLLRKNLINLEKSSRPQYTTQIFIETPYRNRGMIETLLSSLHPDTKLCIAANITGPDEYIRTHRIRKWKRVEMPDLHKIPCIFLIAGS